MNPARPASDHRPPESDTGRHTPAAAAGARPGLRERKKIKTRRTIRAEAFRLFAEQGYDATTVDQIAAAAEVSPSTFFRYFPTKEDLVVTDEYDPLTLDALAARPADEPLLQSLRHAVLESLRQVVADEPDEVRQRMRLLRDVPAVRGRMAESVSSTAGALAEALSRRGGVHDVFEARVLAGAFLGAMQETVLYWSEDGGPEDLVALIERALDVLGNGLGRR
ncbi:MULTISPECIES: TetR family transcriptional regulator [Streptomyces]|uniref:TetR family transcriptional regulator n=1 Tax=Streptomyces lycii TaxID=2654337 RepID=A0ABQ7FLW9_9ACTN|nr:MULTISPECIES: TetR family transcriptional regulator [Streptomyces]KAF4409623.1 TetR family transcriptional regulator [Streptomyces lycii]PGH48489.1 TetR family transcriptional regulator [Streptomyces sp. Ru87]